VAYYYFFIISGVGLSPLGTAATSDLLYKGWCGLLLKPVVLLDILSPDMLECRSHLQWVEVVYFVCVFLFIYKVLVAQCHLGSPFWPLLLQFMIS
jgi:hypothetical protein